jgi:hypothetical protein
MVLTNILRVEEFNQPKLQTRTNTPQIRSGLLGKDLLNGKDLLEVLCMKRR